ncbi:MAG: hypothetical protein M3220_17570, partial [Chloroflexota bacterium]|nr:hypothetical protein [Chloroflexota bacterium]
RAIPGAFSHFALSRTRLVLADCSREIGLSWKGIDKLLSGSEPHAATRQKLTAWYLRRTAASEDEADGETMHAALALMVRHLPPGHREEATATILSAVRNVGEANQVPEPKWLRELSVDSDHPPVSQPD